MSNAGEGRVRETENTGDAPPSKKSRLEMVPRVEKGSIRQPTWTYFHLSLHTIGPIQTTHDLLTARQNLNAALSKYFGLFGSAVPIDILKHQDRELWIRVPRENASLVQESLAAWHIPGSAPNSGIKYVIHSQGDWLVNLVSGDGQDLF